MVNSIQANDGWMDNAVLDMLVSQGIVGCVIFLIRAGNTLWSLEKRIRDVKAEDWTCLCGCFAVIAAMGAGSLFISMVFYLNGPQTYIFWLCFGYMMTLLVPYKDESCEKSDVL